MQLLDLNLATHPFRNNTLLWIGHALAGCLMVAFAYWNVTAFLEQGQALSDLQNRTEGYEKRMADLDQRDAKAIQGIGDRDIKLLEIQARLANSVIAKKALSWTRLFNLLERTVPYEVKTVAIRPAFFAASRGGAGAAAVPEGAVPVAIEGVAQSVEAFLEFERALLLDPHFDRVEPERTSFSEGSEVQFEVRFLYYPEGTGQDVEIPPIPPVLPEVAAAESERDEPEAAGPPPGAIAPASPAPVPAQTVAAPPPPEPQPPLAPARAAAQPEPGAEEPAGDSRRRPGSRAGSRERAARAMERFLQKGRTQGSEGAGAATTRRPREER